MACAASGTPLLMRFRGRAADGRLIHRRRGSPARAARHSLAAIAKACSSNKTLHGPSTRTPATSVSVVRLRPLFSIWPIRAIGPSFEEPLASRVYDIVVEAVRDGQSRKRPVDAAWPARSFSAGNTANWSRSSARSKMPSTRKTSSIPGRLSVTISHLMLRNLTKPWLGCRHNSPPADPPSSVLFSWPGPSRQGAGGP